MDRESLELQPAEGWTGCHPSVSESLELQPDAFEAFEGRGGCNLPRLPRAPSVSLGIPRLATCCGCPAGFEGRTGCHPSVSESLELQPAGCPEAFEGWTGCHPSVSEFLELQPAAAAQRVLKGGQGPIRQFRVPSVSFGILRIATCCGCPEGFEGWTRNP